MVTAALAAGPWQGQGGLEWTRKDKRGASTAVRNVREQKIQNREAVGFAVAVGYACLAATRDVYLGGLVQRISPSAVALAAFGASTVILLPAALARYDDTLGILRRQANTLCWINITSAIGWLSFLASLRLIEPALVQILYFGVSPLSVVWIDRHAALTRVESPIFFGLFMSLVFAGLVAVSGFSGMGMQPAGKSILGVTLAIAGGVAMSLCSVAR